MADHASQNMAFAQGLQKQLVRMTKSALNPRIIPKIMYDPKRAPILEALGKSIFARSHNQSNPITGMAMTGSAGYGQLRDLHEVRLNHIKELIGLRKGLHSQAPGSTGHSALAQHIADKMRGFQSTKRQRLTEIGAVAEPRMNFMTKTLPALGAGAAGIGAGAVAGNVSGTTNSQADVAGAPFSERLNYLLHPGVVPRSTPPTPVAPQSDPLSAEEQ